MPVRAIAVHELHLVGSHLTHQKKNNFLRKKERIKRWPVILYPSIKQRNKGKCHYPLPFNEEFRLSCLTHHPKKPSTKLATPNTIEAAFCCFKCSAQSARIECYRSRSIIFTRCLAGISMVLPSFIKCAIFNLLKLKFKFKCPDLRSFANCLVWLLLSSLHAISMNIGPWHAVGLQIHLPCTMSL